MFASHSHNQNVYRVSSRMRLNMHKWEAPEPLLERAPVSLGDSVTIYSQNYLIFVNLWLISAMTTLHLICLFKAKEHAWLPHLIKEHCSLSLLYTDNPSQMAEIILLGDELNSPTSWHLYETSTNRKTSTLGPFLEKEIHLSSRTPSMSRTPKLLDITWWAAPLLLDPGAYILY